jgi:hypothetical protein
MHAPISGLLLSEEILDGTARTLDIAPLRIDRFRQEGRAIEYQLV